MTGVQTCALPIWEMFDTTGKKGNAEGGRIGFESGGNGGTHALIPELEALIWKSLEGPLSGEEKDRLEYLADTTGYLSGNWKAEGGLIPGYATGGVSNLFRSR